MDDKKVILKWWHLRRIAMTGDYIGGILAGFGFGIMLMAWAVSHDFIRYPMITLCFGAAIQAVGLVIALRAQKRYVTNEVEQSE